MEHVLGLLDQRTSRHSRGPIASLRPVANPLANLVALHVHVEERRRDFSAIEGQRPTPMGNGGSNVTRKSPEINLNRQPQGQRVYCKLAHVSRYAMSHVDDTTKSPLSQDSARSHHLNQQTLHTTPPSLSEHAISHVHRPLE